MIARDRSEWLEDGGDLHVFVPGLMATGILVSVGMLIWDAIKKLMPDVSRRARAARLAVTVRNRASDLTSIELGEAPSLGQIPRVRRNRGNALLMAIGALVFAATISYVTMSAYLATDGTLAGRGWTLSMGFSVVGVLVVSGGLWLCTALMDDDLPTWIEHAQTKWPIGILPEPTQEDA